ncbi:lipoprotein [gut metagenome]|uniref:Lipoprotein n=1 Tax=gut metagenome TaxID=749906 RepID=J9H338_9ZZZZ
MKKWTFLVAALLSSATLCTTSCVDDNESASVTNIRDAKAEQLKALAEMYKAQGEAALIQANAEKVYKEAQAEYQKAMAEAQKGEEERAKQQFVLTMQKLEAQTKSAIIQLEMEMAQYKDQILTSHNDQLSLLYSDYENAVKKMNTLVSDLATAQANIAALTAGVEYAKIQSSNNIRVHEQNIAGYEAQIELLNDPAYTNIDRKELWAKYQAAEKKYDLAWETLKTNEGVAAKQAGDAVKAALLAVDITPIRKVQNIVDNKGVANPFYYEVESTSFIVDIQLSMSSDDLYKNFKLNETNKLNADREFAETVADALADLGTSADKEDKTTAYGQLAAANKALTDANAMPETNDSEKGAKKQAIASAETAIAQAKDNLADKQAAYDKAVAEQKEYNEAFAAVDIAALNKASEAVQPLVEAQEKAKEAYTNVWKEVNKLYAEKELLNQLYNNATDIESMIADLQENIAYAQQQIAYYKNEFITNAEVSLAKENQKIENLKSEIEIQKQIIKVAENALKSALGGEETPETKA